MPRDNARQARSLCLNRLIVSRYMGRYLGCGRAIEQLYRSTRYAKYSTNCQRARPDHQSLSHITFRTYRVDNVLICL